MKVALLTGSATGLGAVIAHHLALKGYAIAINYRKSKEVALETVKHLKILGAADCIAIQADLSDSAQTEHLAIETLATFGHIDVLIHTAGPFLRERKPLTENSASEWFNMINGNLSSAFFLCKNLIPSMRRRGYGRIITFGFDRADQAPDQYYRGPYASAKTGLVSLTRTLAIEERPHGITTNMICPGDIRKKEKELAIAELRQQKTVSSSNPCKAILDTIDLFLSPASQEINGAIIHVNGGKNIFHEIDLPNFPRENSYMIGQWVLVHPWEKERGRITQISVDYYGRNLYTIQNETDDKIGQFTHYQIEKLRKEDF